MRTSSSKISTAGMISPKTSLHCGHNNHKDFLHGRQLPRHQNIMLNMREHKLCCSNIKFQVLLQKLAIVISLTATPEPSPDIAKGIIINLADLVRLGLIFTATCAGWIPQGEVHDFPTHWLPRQADPWDCEAKTFQVHASQWILRVQCVAYLLPIISVWQASFNQDLP